MPLNTKPGTRAAPRSRIILRPPRRDGVRVGRFDAAAPPIVARGGPGIDWPLGLPADLSQCAREIPDQIGIAALAGAGAGDQDVIRPRPSLAHQHLGRRGAQSPLRPVADHRVADFAACRKANPHNLTATGPEWLRRGLQQQTRAHRPTARCGDTEKIGAGLQPYKTARHRCFGQSASAVTNFGAARPTVTAAGSGRVCQADRRLRPFARRAAITRRPPGVAIRARKPWRRLRISLLGW
jgi:hypothetical protein